MICNKNSKFQLISCNWQIFKPHSLITNGSRSNSICNHINVQRSLGQMYALSVTRCHDTICDCLSLHDAGDGDLVIGESNFCNNENASQCSVSTAYICIQKHTSFFYTSLTEYEPLPRWTTQCTCCLTCTIYVQATISSHR